MMPQLDFSTYPSQIFWLFISFAVLYFVMHFFILPAIAKVMAERQAVLAEGENQSAEIKENIAKEIREYEAIVSKARSQAKDILEDAQLLAKQDRLSKLHDLDKRLSEMFAEKDAKVQTILAEHKKGLEEIVLRLVLLYNKSIAGESFSNSFTEKNIKSAITRIVKKV